MALALRSAALSGPGTVVQLAERAQVGYAAARYTASRLVAAGELVVLGDSRPAMLGQTMPAESVPSVPQEHDDACSELDSYFAAIANEVVEGAR